MRKGPNACPLSLQKIGPISRIRYLLLVINRILGGMREIKKRKIKRKEGGRSVVP